MLIWLVFIILTLEFVDWPVPKTLDIFVCQTSENKAFKTQHSVRTRTRFNLIPSLHANSAAATTREEIKVHVRRIHWGIRLKDDK